MKGSVTGTLDVDATIDAVSAGVTAETWTAALESILEPSTIGGLAIDRAILDGDYRDRTGEIRQFEITGRDLNVKASGTLALNDTGESNLTFDADSPRLEEIGKLVDVPVTGIAQDRRHVTGNGRGASGGRHADGSGLKYGDNGALTVAATYTARVPDLDVDRGGGHRRHEGHVRHASPARTSTS